MIKTFLTEHQIKLHLKQKIIKGDRGDGIPNILSPDDSFVSKIRQKTITSSKLNHLLSVELDNEPYYERNKTLIDLNCIPEDLKENILNTYQTAQEKKGKLYSKLMTYHNPLELVNLFYGDKRD
jgi:hypothetical protein